MLSTILFVSTWKLLYMLLKEKNMAFKTLRKMSVVDFI